MKSHWRNFLLAGVLLPLSLLLGGCGESAKSLFSEGQLALSGKFYEISTDALRRALDKDPENESTRSSLSGAYLSWAQSLTDSGQKEEAEEVLKEGLSLLPEDPALLSLQEALSGK